MNKYRFAKLIYLAFWLCGVAPISLPGQTVTTLASFDSTNGANPSSALIQGIDGNLYGVVPSGGVNNAGTIFKITPSGSLSTVHQFCSKANCADGSGPLASLVLANDGNYYGTTAEGGANQNGTVFKLTPAGKLATLYSFCSLSPNCADGTLPEGGVIQGANGNLYGTTAGGGTDGFGTIFEITLAGKLTTLYSFCSGSNCGEFPQAPLVQAANGELYGMTPGGGSGDWGVIFEITPNGKEATLYTFGSDGLNPRSGLIQASNGLLYGSTLIGGLGGDGMLFSMTPAGKLTSLYEFCALANCTDGGNPYAGPIQGTDGNLYGSTAGGGANTTDCLSGCGTLYKITTTGKLATLYSFCSQSNCADGIGPDGNLVQATNGTFYGTTHLGANSACNFGCGTVFSLSVGLGPFVQTVTTSGQIGAQVIILGNGLSGTTSVKFNGTPATFTVVSNTEITTTVPTGATTGIVEVTTPSRTLKSNVKFRVRS